MKSNGIGKKKRQNKERDIRVKSGGGFITFI